MNESGGCPFDFKSMLQLQCNLWNGFMDRLRSLNQQQVQAALGALMMHEDKLWMPTLTRTIVESNIVSRDRAVFT